MASREPIIIKRSQREFPEFSNLPIDLQTRILSQSGPILRRSPTLSKNLLSNLKLKLCELNISPRELRDYITTESPSIFSVYLSGRPPIVLTFFRRETVQNITYWYIKKKTVIHTINNEIILRETILEKDNTRSIDSISYTIDEIIPMIYGDGPIRFDLLTKYRILNRRKSCLDQKELILLRIKQNLIDNYLNLTSKYVSSSIISYLVLSSYLTGFNLNKDPLSYREIIFKIDKSGFALPEELHKPEVIELMNYVQYLFDKANLFIDNLSLYD